MGKLKIAFEVEGYIIRKNGKTIYLDEMKYINDKWKEIGGLLEHHVVDFEPGYLQY